MSIYVIDTARSEAWRTAFPNAILVCENPDALVIELVASDVIFAHAHEERCTHNPDLVLRYMAANCTAIQKFCAALVLAGRNGVAPIVIIYSGDRIQPGKATYWKKLARSNTGPLAGYLEEALIFNRCAITRDVTPDELTAQVNAMLTELGVIMTASKCFESRTSSLGNACPFGPEGGLVDDAEESQLVAGVERTRTISVGDALHRSAEALIAARLLCEAKQLCESALDRRHCGILLYCPSEGLLALADNVLKAADQGQSPEQAVKSFVAALDNEEF